jgi:hypothetical protein
VRTPLLLLAIAACGGSSAKKPEEPARSQEWTDMNHEARQKFMKDVFMPKMKVEFAAFDPKFQTMDCKTCHGAGAEDGSFEMPNPQIKPLPNNEAAFVAWVSKDAAAGRFAEFMVKKVEPMTGELLHLSVFDPKTKTGDVSCSTCHTLIDDSGKVITDTNVRHHDHDHH